MLSEFTSGGRHPHLSLGRDCSAQVGLGQAGGHDLDDVVAHALERNSLILGLFQGRIGHAEALARGLFDPDHVLADDVFCHARPYERPRGKWHETYWRWPSPRMSSETFPMSTSSSSRMRFFRQPPCR